MKTTFANCCKSSIFQKSIHSFIGLELHINKQKIYQPKIIRLTIQLNIDYLFVMAPMKITKKYRKIHKNPPQNTKCSGTEKFTDIFLW